MRIWTAFLLLAMLASPSMAQQLAAPDPAFMQRAINALQIQRNNALDAAAVSEARATGLTEDLAKAYARIKELEAGKPETGK